MLMNYSFIVGIKYRVAAQGSKPSRLLLFIALLAK